MKSNYSYSRPLSTVEGGSVLQQPAPPFSPCHKFYLDYRNQFLFSPADDSAKQFDKREARLRKMSGLVIGSAGVGILLVAFVLNLLRFLHERHPVYLLMNVVGSGLAGWYAWEGGNIPFIVLEVVWGGVALTRLLLIVAKTDSRN